MRIREVLTEKQDLNKNQKAAVPAATSVGVPGSPVGPTNYYHKYRLGVMMACAPEDAHDYPVSGEFVDDMVMIGYTQADRDMIDASVKKFGYKPKKISSAGSKENDDTGKISPVAQWNKKK